jgi:hypothetical protein
MPLMKWARPYAARYARGKPKTAGDSPAHGGRYGLQAHTGLPLPGGKPGHVNAAV